MDRRFSQFGVRQLLLLFAVLCLLLAIMAPRLHRVYQTQRLEHDSRRLAAAARNLETAVRNDDLALARTALAAGASANQFRKSSSPRGAESLLFECIETGQVAMLDLLLAFGADVERLERLPGSVVFDGPPLYAAIRSSQPAEVRLEMIRLLVEHGADVRRNHAGHDAMDLALFHFDPQVANLLEQFGLPYGPREMAAFNRLEELRRVVKDDPGVLTKRFKPLDASRPNQGPTLLGTALSRGHREISLFLIESGAPLDTVEGLGQTLLHLAGRGGDPELIRLLVARGLDVNARDKYEDTPLIDSAWRAPPEAISALIEAGAHVNAIGINKRTALHSAVRAVRGLPVQGQDFSERVDVIQVLLAAGADRSVPDESGETALDWARRHSPQIAELLMEATPSADGK